MASKSGNKVGTAITVFTVVTVDKTTYLQGFLGKSIVGIESFVRVPVLVLPS